MSTETQRQPRWTDFSIEQILREDPQPAAAAQVQGFQWLYCTRYRPPKLPRVRRSGTTARRRLGRSPRIPFSSTQVALLERRYQQSAYLSGAGVAELAKLLDLSETRVKIWFQNRRARERRESELKCQTKESKDSESDRDTKQITLELPQVYSFPGLCSGRSELHNYMHNVQN